MQEGKLNRYTIPQEYSGFRLDQTLQRMFPLYSRSILQKWIREFRVTVEKQLATPKQKVWGGELIEILPAASTETNAQAEAIALHIVYEDEDILVINKPVGLVVHPGNGNRAGTLLNALLNYLPNSGALPRAGIVHRLDKDTSGLLVVAKTLVAHTNLIRQFQSRTIKREYLALVHGTPPASGSIEAPIGRHPINRIKMAVTDKGKPARTHYNAEEYLHGFTLLRCNLESGRTHQIRVHMQSIGYPIVGDRTYSASKINNKRSLAASNFQRQALHATKLELSHPSSNEHLIWHAELPTDISDLLTALRKTI